MTACGELVPGPRENWEKGGGGGGGGGGGAEGRRGRNHVSTVPYRTGKVKAAAARGFDVYGTEPTVAAGSYDGTVRWLVGASRPQSLRGVPYQCVQYLSSPAKRWLAGPVPAEDHMLWLFLLC